MLPDAVRREAFAEASRFRGEFYECLTARRDELFELADAVLCADGAVKSPVDLTLLPEHWRGHGAMCGGLNPGQLDVDRLRMVLAGLPLPRFDGGRLVLAVDVSPWLRSDAPCSAERLFCHVSGRAKTASQFIPGWLYSFVAVLEPGATSWTAILNAVRLGPADDATAVTAAQRRGVVERLLAAGQWQAGTRRTARLVCCSLFSQVRGHVFSLNKLSGSNPGRIRVRVLSSLSHRSCSRFRHSGCKRWSDAGL
ncbi:transposase [Streptomyces sp. NBC_00582]|uniref:transposase n=1 Tax=Streptomyces sp. NBC_00582 TaxID=2975783 RepID=UPI002E80A542|nr:transposase [Streptomyces sp. NBC_00582]